MSEEENNRVHVYEEIVKKTKTGSITLPKKLREELFAEEEIYFKLSVEKEGTRIILDRISKEEASRFADQHKNYEKTGSPKLKQKERKLQKSSDISPNWGDYFVYDFKNKEKVQPILESAFYKFAETPINFEDAFGRVKYALISFLTSTKTENAKLYYAIERFLLDIINLFDQPNLLDWIFEKLIPKIESKFLYELALLDLVETSIKVKRYEKAELYIFYVLKNIDEYPKSEMYNIMNSFKQLVKKVKNVERSDKIDILLKEKLIEYGQGVEDIDYKIQIIEFFEDLKYIELAYDLAKNIQVNLPPESLKIEEIRKLVNRLHTTPISEHKPESSIDYDEADDVNAEENNEKNNKNNGNYENDENN
jgi:bifunctional DNA-binding transcriptional regulator/antitoxin component of YhaV-PrlF toxin-antitoxin module